MARLERVLGNEWFTITGLVFDAVGVGLIATAARLSKEAAAELGVTRLAGSSLEENLRLPMVQHLLRESRRTKNGLVLILVGFALQIVGSWP